MGHSDPNALRRWLTLLQRAAGAAPVANDLLTYQGLNQAEWMDLDAWIQERARVYNNAVIGVNNGIWTALPMNSELYDPSGMHAAAPNPSFITMAVPGRYSVGGNIQFAANAVGSRWIAVRSTAPGPVVTWISQQAQQATAAGNCSVTAHCEWEFVAGEYVELLAYQNSGGALNVVAAAQVSPEFWAHRLS